MNIYATATRRLPLSDGCADALARAAQGGEQAARDVLWWFTEANLSAISRATARRLAEYGEAVEADDAAQEAYLVFVALVAEWRGPEPFAAYLFGLFRWRVRDALRRLRPRRPDVLAPAPFEAEDARALWHERETELVAFAESLPDMERVVFVLRVRDGLTEREIAAHLGAGVMPRTVGRAWHRALDRLREAE